MIEAKYGNQALAEAAGELVRTTLGEALGKEGLKPASGPRIEHTRLGRGESFEYVAEFEVYPEIKQADLSGKQIDRPDVTITDEDIDQTMETIRQQRRTWHDVEREAKEGDQVLIGFINMETGFRGYMATGNEDRTVVVLSTPHPSDDDHINFSMSATAEPGGSFVSGVGAKL